MGCDASGHAISAQRARRIAPEGLALRPGADSVDYAAASFGLQGSRADVAGVITIGVDGAFVAVGHRLRPGRGCSGGRSACTALIIVDGPITPAKPPAAADIDLATSRPMC